MKLEDGREVRWLKGRELAENAINFHYLRNGAIKVAPNGDLFPGNFLGVLDDVYNFKWRPTDVGIMGSVKTGSTWIKEIVWTMLHNPNLDNPFSELNLFFKIPLLEYEGHLDPLEALADPSFLGQIRQYCPSLTSDDFSYTELTESVPDPRVIKCNLNFHNFNPNALDTSKVVYMLRNPKDCCVSNYHYLKTLTIARYPGTVEEFVDLYCKGEVLYGGVDAHFKAIWPYRKHKNLYLIYYENLKKDTFAEIKKLDQFLGTGLTDEQINNVIYRTSFKQMKKHDNYDLGVDAFTTKDKDKHGYFRKGAVGDYKTNLPAVLNEKLNQYFTQSLGHLEGLPYKFDD